MPLGHPVPEGYKPHIGQFVIEEGTYLPSFCLATLGGNTYTVQTRQQGKGNKKGWLKFD
jgi:hypothetical protein